MAEDNSDYWIVKIPKPWKLLKKVMHAFRGSSDALRKPLHVDIPSIALTSLFVGVIAFIFFTIVIRIPDVIAAFFTAFVVFVYLYFMRREMKL